MNHKIKEDNPKVLFYVHDEEEYFEKAYSDNEIKELACDEILITQEQYTTIRVCEEISSMSLEESKDPKTGKFDIMRRVNNALCDESADVSEKMDEMLTDIARKNMPFLKGKEFSLHESSYPSDEERAKGVIYVQMVLVCK